MVRDRATVSGRSPAIGGKLTQDSDEAIDPCGVVKLAPDIGRSAAGCCQRGDCEQAPERSGVVRCNFVTTRRILC
jgi:hypothetical protein